MTYAATPGGIYFPHMSWLAFATGTAATLSTATHKCAMIGNLYIEGRFSTKVLDTTGSSAIQFRTAGVTFANVGTALDVGIQDVAADSAGPLGRPDGTFDVKTTVSSGAPPSANAWNSFAMTSGTKTMSHGDRIAVVWDLTAKGGVDSIAITPGTNAALGMPFFTTNLGTWLTTNAVSVPNCVVTFSDGTLGYIDNAMPISSAAAEAFRDIDNPDERALVFQVPWNCKIDAIWASVGATNSSGTFDLTLYSDPLVSPTSMASTSVLPEQLGVQAAAQRLSVFNLSTEQTLLKNTYYAVAVRATGATSTRIFAATLGDQSHRSFFPGTTTLVKATRDGGSGAFGTLVSTVIYQMGVRISQLDDGTGTGSAGVMYNPNLSGT